MDQKDMYSPGTGLIYVFNLIVGTGALTMPAAFGHSGWLLSIIVITLLCFMSFITVTFVIESMSIANAVNKIRRSTVIRLAGTSNQLATSMSESPDLVANHSCGTSNSELQEENEAIRSFPSSSFAFPNEEKLPLISSTSDGFQSQCQSRNFEITERVELGEMANLFFSKALITVFYICIAVYLYGDLAIYAAAISKSLRDVTCSWEHACNGSVTPEYAPTNICWTIGSSDILRKDAYRLYVFLVLICLGPFAFFNVQKTKYIQILTSLFRWFAFSSMIVLASIALFEGKGRGNPKPVNVAGLPNLFGVCVYSFMCHHSLPSLVTPIKEKKNIFWLLFADYLLILVFYSLLSFTGAFAFENVQDIITLNFQRDKCSSGDNDIVPPIVFLQYFLPLFPVFSLSASFPIISITLTNNIKNLLMPYLTSPQTVEHDSQNNGQSSSKCFFFTDRLLFPLLAIVPPALLALTTENLQFLVGVTGSYAGACIQYVIPALLIYYARKMCPIDDYALAGEGLRVMNSFKSPFKRTSWVVFVLLWAALCVIFVTVDHIIG